MLGPTDPKDAPEGALRGIIAGDWEKLGLKAPCNGGDNAVHASASPYPNPKPNPNPKRMPKPKPDPTPDQVHASASPFEGLAERTNWLGVAIADDSFGKALLAAGVPEETIKKWSSDPQVTYDAETAKSTGRAARPKRPRCAAPELAARASSGRARRLRAAQHSQRSGRPPGRPATASAARGRRHRSRRFHRLLVHTGKAKGSIFDALEDLDYQECLDKCVAISKA